MTGAVHKSTKTFTQEVGLSACFRQWRATSHCNKLHGYALGIRIEFASYSLDARNWVVDFGGLKDFKKELEETFDHKLVVAQDDPALTTFLALEDAGLADVVILDRGVGCERFAEHVAFLAMDWLARQPNDLAWRVWVSKVEVSEHGANSGIWERI